MSVKSQKRPSRTNDACLSLSGARWFCPDVFTQTVWKTLQLEGSLPTRCYA